MLLLVGWYTTFEKLPKSQSHWIEIWKFEFEAYEFVCRLIWAARLSLIANPSLSLGRNAGRMAPVCRVLFPSAPTNLSPLSSLSFLLASSFLGRFQVPSSSARVSNGSCMVSVEKKLLITYVTHQLAVEEVSPFPDSLEQLCLLLLTRIGRGNPFLRSHLARDSSWLQVAAGHRVARRSGWIERSLGGWSLARQVVFVVAATSELALLEEAPQLLNIQVGDGWTEFESGFDRTRPDKENWPFSEKAG